MAIALASKASVREDLGVRIPPAPFPRSIRPAGAFQPNVARTLRT